MPKRSSTGRLDLNQLAKSIVDQATDNAPTASNELTGKKADSRKGGLKGGLSRMEKLTPEQRKELAKKAAHARWGNATPAKIVTDAAVTRLAKQR